MKSLFTILLVCFVQLCSAQRISNAAAKADLLEFKNLLETQSSYFQLTTDNWEQYFEQLFKGLENRDSIPISFLAFEMEKVIAKTLDRHANIKMDDFEEDEVELFNLYCPFGTAPLNGKVVALQFDRLTKTFSYYNAKYPVLKTIDGVRVKDFLAKYAYRRNKSPEEGRLFDGLRDLCKIGELYFKNGDFEKREVEIVLTNGRKNKKLVLPLDERKHSWWDMHSYSSNRELMSKIWRAKPFDFEQLYRWLPDSIAYLGIPDMLSYEDYPEFERFLEGSMEKCRGAKALVLDLRGNGGGTRDILMTLSRYLVPKESSPWVANVAYVRSDQHLDEDIESMRGRYLYNQNSELLSEASKEAIEKFSETFKTEVQISAKHFSQPYYMVLESGPQPLTCPVYLLVNEECFSAASVFAAAFKGLPNVKLAGVTTNGSSGRSRKFYLEHSNIRVKLSTMVSLQRNGNPLDGYGTEPDILIPRNEAQVLGKEDYQLDKLIQLIKGE